jgi:intraflagellar transport protein 122
MVMYQVMFLIFFSQAYSIACLGVTTSDWEKLGAAALDELSLDIARKAFQHTENISLLQLVDLLQVNYIIYLGFHIIFN